MAASAQIAERARQAAEKVLQQEGLTQYGFLRFPPDEASSAGPAFHSRSSTEEAFLQQVRTVVVVLFPYYPGAGSPEANLSLYCRGADYHTVVPKYLEPAGKAAERAYAGAGEDFRFAAYADTGPFPDRDLAYRAGLGVRGLNSMLINRQYGSYCFIGTLALTAALPADEPHPVPGTPGCLLCGACRKACPGHALLENGGFDTDKCRSGITQKKGELSEEEIRILLAGRLIFGCDICQNVCPLNREVRVSPLPEFSSGLIERLSLADLEGLNGRTFRRKYPDRAFTWRGPEVLRRNLELMNQPKIPLEIERKYLVKTLPEAFEHCPHCLITQGYVSRDPVVRFRKTEENGTVRYVKTIKGSGLGVHTEQEEEITEAGYEQMKSRVQGRIIRKTRYRIPLSDGLTAELDLFEGELSPLKLVEVEFPSAEAMNAFEPPDWFGEEVTDSGEYQNSRLSETP